MDAKLPHGSCNNHLTSSSSEDAGVVGQDSDQKATHHVSSKGNAPVAHQILTEQGNICLESAPQHGSTWHGNGMSEVNPFLAFKVTFFSKTPIAIVAEFPENNWPPRTPQWADSRQWSGYNHKNIQLKNLP